VPTTSHLVKIAYGGRGYTNDVLWP
jgi:hypothetical protein